MKRFITALLAAYVGYSPVQAQITGKSVPEFKTTAGTVVHVGDTLHLGRGSLPSGEFQYVFVPDNVFTGSKRLNFTSQMSNLSVRVKDLRQFRRQDRGRHPGQHHQWLRRLKRGRRRR
jgi:hypothetical protein